MDQPVEIVLVGAGGYGEYYLDILLSPAKTRAFRLVGAVEPFPERCRHLAGLQASGVPLYSSLEDCLDQCRCDLVIIVSPIHLHCQQTGLALDRGSHVLLEKPLCASLAQIEQMRAAQRRSGKAVTVGFQWSFSPAVRRLKADILAGRFGRARRLRTLVAWPRDEAYYTRNLWAGRQTSDEGEPILDSPVNNAAAHYLHNMLFVLGERPEISAWPEHVEAVLGRANAIENYDTAALRIRVAGGAELLFYTSHSVARERGPVFTYEFEKGIICFEAPRSHIVATLNTGELIDYGSPDAEPFQKLWDSIDTVVTGQAPICGIEAAVAHTACVIQAQRAAHCIHNFPPSLIRVDRSGRSPVRSVTGLLEAMNDCYERGKLPSGSRWLSDETDVLVSYQRTA